LRADQPVIDEKPKQHSEYHPMTNSTLEIDSVVARTAPDQSTRELRIGAIGVDSSHLPEFSRRMADLFSAGSTRCRVTSFFDDGNHHLPEADVQKWKEKTLALGATEASSIDSLLDQVDGVMVLAVSGNSHYELALPSLHRGLPTYIDKPLTCNLEQARSLVSVAAKTGARCYSASSLRFATEIPKLDRDKLGQLHAIDAYGPGELNPDMEGLFFYGVHTIEMVDAIWGPGVARVRCETSPDRDLVDLHYKDGRHAHLRLERQGAYEFGATVHGSKGVESFKVDFAEVYNNLILGMTRFFETGIAPVDIRDILENIAVMSAGNLSMAEGGRWVDIPELL
jgi:predicted dehydrogenase